ncbi:MAG: branched-chain amino acid ABC transporter permease [Alphaproteobacteria bacterium]|nr:branched-chain amino acid ABC transporter permease [Alphaproteobacteria bacterium]MBU0796051.1 branched-chain amino acid ABC transporter permease [Alphaproteobacteria bacterium]MBU0886814.1 branched-chain amino acid ABC transporter permease [Alphaproteobacteria bacterium]MBU1812444.1 branched-chain amino acid ABC transporter permease [Alphaproteobacteria bacterium]MBU2090021.1 branched-chain amino acid ABC transporter permease [Alphaproteobacteria bacterium]
MMDIFGIPHQALMGQIMLGLVNGAFYAVLSLGLAIIFGLLRIVNFAHGAFFMLGAFVAFLVGRYFGIGYWPAMIIAPLVVGVAGILFERFALRRIYKLDPLYGLFLTFGLVLVLEGGFRVFMGSSGNPFPTPASMRGVVDLGFMMLPIYRGFVILMAVIVCAGTWIVIEKTRMGAYLRAATERPELTQAFGINVPILLTLTYGAGVALAGFAGVLAAPIQHVNPSMGSDLVIIVFAIVVIGGLGSVLGSAVTGLGLGVIEGLAKVYYSEASTTVVFLVMALVLLLRPAGLFGREES